MLDGYRDGKVSTNNGLECSNNDRIVLGSREDLLDGYRDGKVGINNGLECSNNDCIVLGPSEDLLDSYRDGKYHALAQPFLDIDKNI